MGILILGFFLLAAIILDGVLVYKGLKAADRIIEYENFISMMQNQINYAIKEMKRIDASGVFEADDEVGDTFRSLHLVVESLSNFQEREQNG